MKLFRFALFIVHIVIVGLLLATLLNAVIPPSVFPYLNFLSLVFPILIVLHIFLLIIWVILKKKRSILFILCSLFLIAPTRRWINFSQQKEKGTASLQLLTYNIKNGYGNQKEEIETFLKKNKIDIALLQESYINEINRSFNYASYHSSSGVINIFSRPKIIAKGEILKPKAGRPGSAIYTDIEVEGQTIRFISVYLNSFLVVKSMVTPSGEIDKNEKKYRTLAGKMVKNFRIHEEEIEKIIPFIKNSPYPVVLAGDLNAVPNSYEYYQFNKIMKDAFLESGNGSSTSFHDYKFPIRLDYVFVSKEIVSKSYKVDRSVNISDHFPVIVELEIPKK